MSVHAVADAHGVRADKGFLHSTRAGVDVDLKIPVTVETNPVNLRHQERHEVVVFGIRVFVPGEGKYIVRFVAVRKSGKTDLSEIVHTGQIVNSPLGRAQGGQEEPGKDSDDRDDD